MSPSAATTLVALACELIGYDTTSRSAPDEPAREEAALQRALAARLEPHGAEIDLWEPEPDDVAGHPLSVEGIGFEGRPQLAARLRGSGGGRSLLLNGHIDVVPAQREEGWTQDPFDAHVRDGSIVGRGACDMKGGIAAMVIATEVLAETGALRGDIVVCTNTDEESSGVGGLACARHGVAADFAIVTEPSSLEVWPACRGTVYCTIEIAGRAGHAEQEHPHWRDGGAVNAIAKGRFLLDGVDRLRAEWRTRADLRHALLDPPDIVADALRRRRGLARDDPRPRGDRPVRPDPAPAGGRAAAGPPTPRRRSRASCAAGAIRTRGWLSTRRRSAGTPRSIPPRRRSTRRACRRCWPPTPRSACRSSSAASAAGTTARRSRSRPARPR